MDRGQLRSTLTRLLLALALVVGVGLGLSSCRMIFTDTGPLEVTVAGDVLMLAWDGEPESPVPETPSAPSHYELFYRERGARNWTKLAATGGLSAFYTITSNDLPHGEYEFAVRSVRNDGRTSDMHASGDFDAWPTGGWYVKWVPGDT